MRAYILTERERSLIDSFLKNREVSEEDYGSYCQLRHQYKTHKVTLAKDRELLDRFINTTRRPKCFGSSDVVKKTMLRKCTQCDAAAKCLGAYMRSKELIP